MVDQLFDKMCDIVNQIEGRKWDQKLKSANIPRLINSYPDISKLRL